MKIFTLTLILSLKCLIIFSQTNHLVISEVYGGGGNSGATLKSDFIELYNPSNATISVDGWSVQYASANGTSWAVTTLAGSVAASGYYLIKQADGAGGTVNLPTPDRLGTIAMAGASGKVLLVNTAIALTGVNPSNVNIIDKLGYGNTNGFETAATGSTLTSTTSAERKALSNSTTLTMASSGIDALKGNGYDSDNNNTDFIIRTGPDPQNSASNLENGGPAEIDIILPTITAFFPLDNSSVSVINTPTIKFSENVVKGIGNIVIKNISDATSQIIDIKNPNVTITTNTLNIATVNFIANKSYAIQIDGGAVKDIADNFFAGINDDNTWNFTTISAADKTKISSIQGSGMVATAGNYTVEAIVTAVYANLNPSGYFIQEEDGDADMNAETSEALFVVQNNPTVKVGDKVTISGEVKEDGVTPSFNLAVIIPTSFTIVSSDNVLPIFTIINAQNYNRTTAEKFEGMRVEILGEMLVTDNSKLMQHGELSLSGNGLAYQPTQIVDLNDAIPSGTNTSGNSNASVVTAINTQNTNNRLILDNADAAVNVIPIPYLDTNIGTIRVGATVSNIKGIMSYGFSNYRIQPIIGFQPNISTMRPTVPTFNAVDVTCVGFNVLNYFNGNGSGGGFPTARGATTLANFNIQRSKIIEALYQINADVVGLMEIENDGVGENSAVRDLVNGLNLKLGADTYSIVNDGENSQIQTTDQIRCAIIYKSAKVTSLGVALQSSNSIFNRSPLAQVFSVISSNNITENFAFVVNHFKSKGGSGSGLDADQSDGQAAFNNTRKLQSTQLVNFINNTVLPSQTLLDKFVSVGDYNAYFEEDPMDILRASNYVVLGEAINTSYLFGGQLGSLDHAVVSQNISSNTEIKKWNINSSEPLFLEYNRPQTISNSPFRSSDHDPIMVGVKFPSILPITLKYFNAIGNGKTVELNWVTSSEFNNNYFELEHATDGLNFTQLQKVVGEIKSTLDKNYNYTHFQPTQGNNYYRLSQTDVNGKTTLLGVKMVKIISAIENKFCAYPNPFTTEALFNLNSNATDLQLIVTNTNGNAVLKTKGDMFKINQYFNNNTDKLISGVYFIFIGNNSQNYHTTVIKQ